MFKSILYAGLFLVFSTNVFYSAKQSDDKILWSESRKLEWSDFHGTSDTASRFAAGAFVGFDFIPSVDNGITSVKITCYFDKKKSWVDLKRVTDHNLNHEQRHFDLAEIYARKFYQKAKPLIQDPSSQYVIDLFKLYKEVLNEHDAMQDEYDMETMNSSIHFMQEQWNKKIDALLQELPQYP